MPIGASAVTGILAVATALTMLETQSEHLICFVGVSSFAMENDKEAHHTKH